MPLVILGGECSDILTFNEQFVGNKEKGRISKRVFQENKAKIPEKQTLLTP